MIVTWISAIRSTFPACCLFIIAGSNASFAQQLTWSRYTNPETGVAIDIPTDLFPVDSGATKNATGRSFSTSDRRADVSIYSMRNEAGDTPASFLRKRFQLPESSAVYRRVTPRVLAVSGFRGDQIWYARCNFSISRVNCVALNYPAQEKRNWDAVVTRMSNTLSVPSRS